MWQHDVVEDLQTKTRIRNGDFPHSVSIAVNKEITKLHNRIYFTHVLPAASTSFPLKQIEIKDGPVVRLPVSLL